MKLKIADIVSQIKQDYIVLGNTSLVVDNVAPIGEANETSLTFCKKLEDLERTKAPIVIMPLDMEIPDIDKMLIRVENPRLAFIHVMQSFFMGEIIPYIHPTAICWSVEDPSLNISVGPFTYISGNAHIGKNSIIGSHVYISGKVVIGENCHIQSHISIGNDGFGYQKNEEGIWEKFPDIGGVLIGDNVDLADHVNVDRGTLGNTIIGDGTKASKYTHIGHNVKIGKNCFLAGKSQFGGGSQVGDDTFIGIKVSLKQGVKVGNNCYIGMHSMVNKDIGDGWVAYGNPCKTIKANIKELWKKGGM